MKRKKASSSFPLWGWALVVVLGLGVWLGGKALAPPPGLNAAPDESTLAQGQAIFQRNCISCHGAQGEGQDPQNPMGKMSPEGVIFAPALNGKGHSWHHPNEMLYEVVKKGSSLANSPMKGFQDKLKDEEIVAVIKYFQSLWPMEVRMARAQRLNRS